MFNSTILNETREIHINDIVPNSSLTVSCHSDKEDCCEGAQGQWKFPNGSVVPEENNSISVTRENGLLRLTPADNVTMPGGEYCCEAQDGRGINRTVCVKLQGQYIEQVCLTTHLKFIMVTSNPSQYNKLYVKGVWSNVENCSRTSIHRGKKDKEEKQNLNSWDKCLILH